MRFELIDRVIERTDERLVAVKAVTRAEEYLQDHFPSFPVLPGVLMLEAMVQAGRALVGDRVGNGRVVLGSVKGLKYGRFVRPGATMRVEVDLAGEPDGGEARLKGRVLLLEPESAGADLSEVPTAASGRFTLRGVRAVGA